MYQLQIIHIDASVLYLVMNTALGLHPPTPLQYTKYNSLLNDGKCTNHHIATQWSLPVSIHHRGCTNTKSCHTHRAMI